MYDRGNGIPQVASDMMSSPAITIEHSSPIGMALCLIYRHNVSRLPVVDDAGRLCGMITYGDIRRYKMRRTLQQTMALMNDPAQYLTVREVMIDHPVAITPATSLHEACDLMFVHKISALPVVDAEHIVVGIVTEQDLFERLILQHDRKLESLTAVYRLASRREPSLAL
jgi:CBS domain-containing protein